MSAQREYCREGFVSAIEAQDLEAAKDWLSALAEHQVDIYGERLVLEALVNYNRAQGVIASATCPLHGEFCCPVCPPMELFACADPIDGIEEA